jgi:uncharacterized protein with HEPN domain
MKSPLSYIQHILDEISFIQKSIAENDLSKAGFLHNDAYKRAFTRSLEIIGEAVKNLPSEFYKQNPLIPWKQMAGMRDRLIHAYFAVDYELVWDVVINHLPDLKKELEKLIR